MPPDLLDDAVEVLLELPGEPALADARLADERDEARASLAPDRVELLLEEAQLVGPADERRLERVRAARAAALADDTDRQPGGDRRGLALEFLVAGRLELDRGLGGDPRRLADEHAAGRRHRLEPRRPC